MTLAVFLRQNQSGLAELRLQLDLVNNPALNSPNLGSFLNATQVASLVGADDKNTKLAISWVQSVAAVPSSHITLSGTRDMLFAPWEHTRVAPTLPPSMRSVIDLVLVLAPPSEHFIGVRSQLKRNANSKQKLQDSGMGPNPQRAAYGVPKDLKGVNHTNLQMVWGTGTFGYDESDLRMFYDQYCPSCSVENVMFDKDNLWAGAKGKNFVEGMLDTSYISSIAPGVRTLVANTNVSSSTEGGEGFGGALLWFLADLTSRTNRSEIPLVLSMSLGSLGFDACDRVCQAVAKSGHTYRDCWSFLQTQFQACMFDSAQLVDRIETEFVKLGVMGTTVLAASGDGASHFAFGPFHGSEIADVINDVICANMNMPVYPASSPYVLSVGGTEWSQDDMYGPSCSKTKPCGWESGGGGFSWSLPAPEYQASAVKSYLAAAKTIAPGVMSPAKTFNSSGRAYPDLASLAQFGIPLCDYGGCSGSGGTSASAPAVAGLISLVNDARLSAGKGPLGFLNPKLYSLMADPVVYSDCFADIGVTKVEDLWDCNTFSTCEGCDNQKGFPAVPQWDAQTGFGQPLFPGWMQHLGPDGEF